MLDGLARAASPVVIGRASALASNVTDGSRNVIPASTSRICVGGLRHQGRMSGHRHGEDDRALRAQRPGELGAGFDRGTLAGDDHLARRVPVGDDKRAVRRGPWTSSGIRASSRPMIAAIAPSSPEPDACMARPRARTSRMPSSREMTPAATSALYWPIEWPAAKAGTGAERRPRPSPHGGPRGSRSTRRGSRAAPARSGRATRRDHPRRGC